MYSDYFGFSRDPFSIAPDPAFLYPSTQHRQALAHLKYGLEREGGFLLLTGEVGTGKTTLVRLLIEQVPASFRIAYVLNATLDRLDILASICEELGISVAGRKQSAKTYVDALNTDLLRAHAEGRKTLVIVEEAQNLPPDVLEMLRLLTNLETNTAKLLHILLVGQPELLDILARPELRQLDQRIVSRCHLQPLDRAETERYLQHRLARAGCQRQLFEGAAVRKLHALTDGVPRKLNLLAERALLGAYAESRDKVSSRQVVHARREVFGAPGHTGKLSWLAGLAVLVSLAALAGAYYFTPLAPTLLAPLSNQEGTAVAATGSAREADAEVVSPQAVAHAAEAEAIEETVAIPPVELPLGPYSALAQRWSIPVQATDAAALCLEVAVHGLFCEERVGVSVDELVAINRPAVLGLEGRGQLLGSVRDGQFELGLEQASEWLSVQQLEARWNGELVYLWRPPAGYVSPLGPGDRNSNVVGWLLSRLQALDPDQPQLITGGNYTPALAEAVARFQARFGLQADGILGQRSIMKLNELEGSVPTLGESG